MVWRVLASSSLPSSLRLAPAPPALWPHPTANSNLYYTNNKFMYASHTHFSVPRKCPYRCLNATGTSLGFNLHMFVWKVLHWPVQIQYIGAYLGYYGTWLLLICSTHIQYKKVYHHALYITATVPSFLSGLDFSEPLLCPSLKSKSAIYPEWWWIRLVCPLLGFASAFSLWPWPCRLASRRAFNTLRLKLLSLSVCLKINVSRYTTSQFKA